MKPAGDTSNRPITAHEVSITEIVAEGAYFGLQKRDLAIDRRFSVEASAQGETLVVVVRDKRDKNSVLAVAEIKDHQALLTPDLRRMYYDVGDDLAARVKKVLKAPQNAISEPKKKRRSSRRP